jgi:type I restriction enzyme S subunit
MMDWRIRSLLDVADLIRGVTYNREEASAQPRPGLVPVLRATNINGGTLNFEDLVFVPERRVSFEQRIRRGDIVLAMSSGSRDVVGKSALAHSDWPGGFGAFCGVLRARSGIDIRYLWNFLQSADYRRQIDSIATGTNINNLSKTTLKSVVLPVAPQDVQTHLSALLERIGAKKGTITTHLALASRTIEGFRQAVLSAACSGRLTVDWREANTEAASVKALLFHLDSRIKGRYRQPAADWEFEVPNTWELVSLDRLTTFITSGSRGWQNTILKMAHASSERRTSVRTDWSYKTWLMSVPQKGARVNGRRCRKLISL